MANAPRRARLMRFLATLSVAGLLTAWPAPVGAAPLTRDKVPEPLRPWIDWVLRGHEETACPFFAGMKGGGAEGGDQEGGDQQGEATDPERRCLWPSRLELDLADRGGRFTQDWMLYDDGWVALPGDAKSWPQDLMVDGRAAVVTARDEQPFIHVASGRHHVAGRFEWEAFPPLLRVPPETGLLALSVRGQAIPFPVRDAEGRVWLQKQAGADDEESRLDFTVQRRVDDSVPLLLTTRLELRVSGRSREVLLGRALPDRFTPMSIGGALPARLDRDGRLQVQVRPGVWTIEIVARHDGQAAALTLPPASGPWSRDEVWVFQAFPALRQVTIVGPPPIDPQQTTLPGEWKSLPAYALHAGDTLRLEEKRRGDSDPAPDRLSLRRTLWLDFDGGGYSVRDQISGSFVRGWRLEMPAPAVLGRVAVEDADQVITRLAAGSAPGIEIRQGEAQIEADSRIPGRRIALPAVGWDADFQRAAATLRLPPGWRVLHAGGVDDVDATWISAWTLLDLFLVLLITVAAARLWGRNAGLLALAALGLSWIEWGAPRWSWLAIVAAAALARVLPAGRLRRGAILLHLATAAVLLLGLLPFLVGQVRSSLYPSLEQPMAWAALAGGGIGVPEAGAGYDTAGDVALGAFGGEHREAQELDTMQRARLKSLGYDASAGSVSAPPPPPKPAGKMAQIMSSNLAPDPKATAQTGPGLPDWRWRTIELSWRGPVTRAQELRLWLVPPAVNAVLGWLRALLLAGLALVVMPRAARGSWPSRDPLMPGRAAVALLLAAAGVPLLALASSTPARADMPTPQMLETLRDRLLEPPDCGRDCVSCPRLALEATRDMLRLRIEIDAAATVAIPLAGNSEQWTPSRVLLDGQPAPGLARGADGSLWIAVAAGTHQVVLEGRLPDRDVVPLPMAIHPRRVTTHADGWRVEGLRDDGQAEETLQLTRVQPRDAAARSGAVRVALEPGMMPPFVRVERELEIGLQWTARTRVTRLTPSGTAVLIEVPLLPGESVTSSEVRATGVKAIVSLAPDVAEISWSSSLAQGAEIALRAPESVPWIEIWRAAVGPVWHLETEGIPAIGAAPAEGVRTREWHPWPGEALRLRITRPQPIDGRTLTVDGSTLTLTPGLRVTDASLQLFARASRGGEHTVTLPEGAVLQTVVINGTEQPIRQDGSKVTLPIVPGRQALRVDWRAPLGVTTLFRAPLVDLGLDSVNTSTVVAMPQDRWTLLIGGPRLGPAVLFWGLLVVNLLLALGLGRLSWTPLRTRDWFLLGLGLTQVPLWASLAIAAWLLALGWRRREPRHGAFAFDALQLLLAAWSAVALVLLFWAIKHGLLGLPDMQIAGNGSTAGRLSWFLDRTGPVLPRPWVISLPLFIYRLAMLAWALWLALAVVRWLKWGWESLSDGGLWKPLRRPKRAAPPVVAPPPVVPPPAATAPAA